MIDNVTLRKVIKAFCGEKADFWKYLDSDISAHGNLFVLLHDKDAKCLCISMVVGCEKLSDDMPKIARREFEDELDYFMNDWFDYMDSKNLDIRMDQWSIAVLHGKSKNIASMRCFKGCIRPSGFEVINEG